MSRFKFLSLFALIGIGSCASTKSRSTSTAVSQKGNILVVLSAKDYVTTKEGRRHATGYFLSELAEPSIALTSAGYTLTFATPGGKAPTMDVVSDDPKWFQTTGQYHEAKSYVASTLALQHPLALESLTDPDLSTYAGVVVPGGHAPIEDLSRSEATGRILLHFHNNRKPTGLICHGPAALLSLPSGGRWAYDGYKMTSFSTAEEQQEEDAGHLDGHMPFYLDEALRSRGGIVTVGTPWSSTAVRDRELITGQNPMSALAFVDLLLEALAE